MGTTLTDKIVADTYDGLIKVTDNNVITGTKKRLTDGFGNDLPILVSTTDFQVDGTLVLGGTTAQYVRGDGSIATLVDLVGLTSVGVSMPTAFSVSNSPLTANGTIAITGAGTAAQYIDGTGSLQTFPTLASADRLVTEVHNKTGATLTKGTIVYISGTQGNLPAVDKALATSDATSAQTFGFVQANISNNSSGFVVVSGKLTDLDTSAYSDGTQLYLSPITAGTYTSTKQYAPNHLVYVGIVVRAHPTQGSIEVKIQNGYELDELHDVIAQTPSNNDGIFYNSTSTKWENKSIATALGFTPVPTTRTISTTAPLSGGGDLSANRTLSISQATTSTNGFLSSTDWNTFNSKVPSTRTLTINGTAYDLSADRSWTIATGLSGSGTTNYVAKFTGSTSIGNSLIYDNGTNVGIGIASPFGRFHSLSTGTGSNTISGVFSDGSTNGNAITISNSTGLSTISATYLSTAIDSALAFQTTTGGASAERIRITASGNVGIGTSTILATYGGYTTLELNGTTGGLLSLDSNGSNKFQMYSNGSSVTLATIAAEPIILSTNASEKMRITSAGNVGIGTASPSLPLHVYNPASALAYFETTSGNGAYAIWRNSGTNFGDVGSALGISGSGSASDFMVASRAGSMILGTSSAERMRITSAGNVGIGIASPNAKLNVAGTTLIQNSGADTWFGYGGSYDNYFSTPNGGKQVFRNASSDIMTLTSAGNVLINTTSDNSTTAKLQVTGGISYQNIFNTQGASYTLALTDQSKIVETNVGSANNVTIPLDSSVNFPIGTEIQVLQLGAGQTTIVATSGVTTRSKSNQLKIANQNTGVTLVKRAANDWYVIGNLTA